MLLVRKAIDDITELEQIAASRASWETKYRILWNSTIKYDVELVLGYSPRWELQGEYEAKVKAFMVGLQEIRDELYRTQMGE